jgi:hypothetical protein
VVERWTPEEARWDGVGELWFDSIEAADAAFASEPVRSLLTDDRAAFLGGLQTCFVEERTVIPPPVQAEGS